MKLKRPKAINTITISQFEKPDVIIKLTNEEVSNAAIEGLEQTLIGFRIIREISKVHEVGWKINCEVSIKSPNGKQLRDKIYIQTQFFKPLVKRMLEGPPSAVSRGIPLYCDCCEKFSSTNCVKKFPQQAYMTAKTVLSAIPLPEIDNYDDVNELRDRDEGERGGG